MAHKKTHEKGHHHEADLHQGQPEEHVVPGLIEERNHRTVRVGSDILEKPVIKLRDEHWIDNAQHKKPRANIDRKANLEWAINKEDPASELAHD